jgi:acetyl-CoA/propionyl-CoA carboxylase biotin carboxyl carrier protein
VTEAVLGVDLVEWQLRVASGEPLPWAGAAPAPKGHAIEARLYAEDVRRGFLPASGTVLRLHEPGDLAHVRVDSGLYEGAVVGTEYDPMLAKVVAWGEDRGQALARLHAALGVTRILGVTTNTGFLRRLLEHPDVRAGRVDTELVDRIAADLAGPPVPDEVITAAGLWATASRASAAGDPWQLADGWRLTGPAPQISRWAVAGETVEAVTNASARASLDGVDLLVGSTRFGWAADGDTLWLGRGGDAWALTELRETIDRTGIAGSGTGRLTSPMPGTVLAVHVAPGESVETGQALVVVEAMKMEHVVAAAAPGTVREVLVKPGDRVVLDQPLAVVES